MSNRAMINQRLGYVLYDLSTAGLLGTAVYAERTKAEEAAAELNDVLVVPLMVGEEVVTDAEAEKRQEAAVVAVDPRPLQIDARLFQAQRELLTKITSLAWKNGSYLPAPGDSHLLEGLLNLTDALADSLES